MQIDLAAIYLQCCVSQKSLLSTGWSGTAPNLAR